MPDRDDEDRPLAERVLQPDPFPFAAELVLAQHILRQQLRQEARDG